MQHDAKASKGEPLRRNSIILAIVFSFVLIAIALGAGLGVGLSHRDVTSVPAATAASPVSTPLPILKNGILNDTSLAAVTTAEGNRHIFFQDINGSLRHNAFDQSSNKWLNGTDYVESDSPPRNLTPIAAFAITNFLILIHFVGTNDLLCATSYQVGRGSSQGHAPSLMNDSFPVAPGSRTISLAQMTSNELNGTRSIESTQVILMYEASNGNLTTLLSTHANNFVDDTLPLTWQNISEIAYSWVSSAWLSPPLGLTGVAQEFGGIEPQAVFISFFNGAAITNSSAPAGYWLSVSNWTTTGTSLGEY